MKRIFLIGLVALFWGLTFDQPLYAKEAKTSVEPAARPAWLKRISLVMKDGTEISGVILEINRKEMVLDEGNGEPAHIVLKTIKKYELENKVRMGYGAIIAYYKNMAASGVSVEAPSGIAALDMSGQQSLYQITHKNAGNGGVMDYMVIRAEAGLIMDASDVLSEQVRAKIREGWEPVGGPAYIPSKGLYQAMIKR